MKWNVKALVGAFNQEKALVGAFSVITNLRMELFETLVKARVMNQPTDSRGRGSRYTSALDCLVTTVRGEGFFGGLL